MQEKLPVVCSCSCLPLHSGERTLHVFHVLSRRERGGTRKEGTGSEAGCVCVCERCRS